MNQNRFLVFVTNLFEVSKYALLVIVLIAIVVAIGGSPLIISGESMMPNFKDKELVYVSRLSYFNDRPIRRGDVVAAKFPADPDKTKLIKRVVGLPGETVEAKDGQIYINHEKLYETYSTASGAAPNESGESVALKPGQYYLVGDNRPGSNDSRTWGPVTREDIFGRITLVVLPFSELQSIDRVN